MAPKLDPISGYLPPGPNAATVDEVRQTFVDDFPTSVTRPVIFEHWKALVGAIKTILPIDAQWIDGSFVTSKENPGDVDLATFLDGPTLDSLGPVPATLLKGLVGGPISKELHECDSYFVSVYPVGHPGRAAYEAARAYWDQWFGHDRAGNRKGYIDLRVT